MSAPWALEDDTERLTVDDLRTIQAILEERADHHRQIMRRLEHAQQLRGGGRIQGVADNLEKLNRYARIARRVGREILELEWEV